MSFQSDQRGTEPGQSHECQLSQRHARRCESQPGQPHECDLHWHHADRRESEPGQPHECDFIGATLTNANLSQANLTGCELRLARHADRRELYRGRSAGGELIQSRTLRITAAQLYSTASYQAHDLTGIGLSWQQPGRREPRRPEPHECELLLRHADQCQSQPGQPHECELLAPR